VAEILYVVFPFHDWSLDDEPASYPPFSRPQEIFPYQVITPLDFGGRKCILVGVERQASRRQCPRVVFGHCGQATVAAVKKKGGVARMTQKEENA
jgi:hypothetical protein